MGVDDGHCSSQKSYNEDKPKPPRLQRSNTLSRQSGWDRFKERAFKVALTVVVPKNKRLPDKPCDDDGLKSTSLRLRRVKNDGEPNANGKLMELEYSEEDNAFEGARGKSKCFDGPSNRSFVPIARFAMALSDDKEEEFTEGDETLQSPTPDQFPAGRAMPMPRFMPMARDLPPDFFKRPVSHEETNSDYVSDFSGDEEPLTYKSLYSCMPPPIFMFCITMAELGFFIYHTKKLLNHPKYGYINKYGPAPLDSSLIYNPTRRYEVWRYITYAFVHSGYMHIINNVVIQLFLGVLLELVHKWWRVLLIYFAGVLAGSLATSIVEPFNYLAGASAGVYALIAAHLSTVILNWTEMEHPWIRVLVFTAFVIHDAGTAIYFAYIVGEKTNVGYAAHLGGATAGLLVGIHVLKNLQWKEWEKILWYTSVVICILLLAFAILWNIVRTDLFP